MVRTIIEARFGVLLNVSVRVRDCLFKIEDLSTIDPEFPNRSRNIPNFSFIKWWNGSRVLRREFHLNSKPQKTAGLSHRGLSSVHILDSGRSM